MKLGCLISTVIACVSLAQAQAGPITVTLTGHSQEYSLSSTSFDFAFWGTLDIAGLGSGSYAGGLPAFDPFGLRSITQARGGPIFINFGGSTLEAVFDVAAGALIPSLGVPPNIGVMLIGAGSGEFAGATGKITLIAQSETMAGPQGNYTWTGTGSWNGPVPFAAFTTKLEITATPVSGFELHGAFTLGGGSTPINPVTQSVLLKVGTYEVTIPAGSFQAGFSGSFNYEGVINGAKLEARVNLMGANAYTIHVEASDVNLAGVTNPVTVTLAFIGNNAGTTTATAEFERILAPVVRADEIFEALLLPGNEVPPHASGAQGFVKIDLHSDLMLNVTQQTIGMPPSDGLLQCCGGPGTIQPVALSLGPAIGTDTFNLTTRLAPSFIALHGGTAALAAADLVAAMESGNAYINVPDHAFPRGEIRGQLLLIPDITEPGTLTVLHGFGGIDGRSPSTGLIRNHEGNLYGTTYGFPFGSVPGNCGTVFKIDKSGNQTILHRFDGTDGANPRLGHLIRDEEGNLYGTTSTGGTVPGGNPGAASGTIFRLDVRGNLTTLYTFSGLFDGGSPSGTLVRNEAGDIFGTTSGGGAQGYGTVFKLDRRGQESVLHSFQAGRGGGGIQPQQGLVADRQGNFYGVTLPGGGPDDHGGNVFRITPAGTETTLYTFSGGADGGVPSAPLLFDEGGNLYGTTQLGGTNNLGTVFELDLSGKETVLHSFAGGLQNDGANPAAGLVRDEAGNFYGTTWAGGLRSSFGSVFKMDATGRITILYSFLPNNGDSPSAGVVRDEEGNLYGVTIPNPLFPLGFGAVFKLTPKGPTESEEPAEPSSSPREGGSDR